MKRIVFDVDGVLSDGMPPPRCKPRPGMRETLEILYDLGAELYVWSSGGDAYAREVTECFGWDDMIEGFYAKPSFPMEEAAALEVLGFVPDLMIDDDPLERVGDWPLHRIKGWYGEGRKKERENAEGQLVRSAGGKGHLRG